AILEGEADATLYAEALQGSGKSYMSSATFTELGVVMTRKRGAEYASNELSEFLKLAQIIIEHLTASQAHLAIKAYSRFGILNFGDCFTYAFAKEKNLPLLFKGDDFSKTDLLLYQPE
ncbi:MAG: type II toxin-antitoxin system VapC family toxin, partial [Verrucomicrobiota bacterium]